MHNEIEVHISVRADAAIDNLPLIDYTVLHGFAREAVSEPTGLLETVVSRIVSRIGASYPGYPMRVAVRKLHPPMAGVVDYSEVCWES